MLSLEPPFHVIDGVSVFRDHADPHQYWYLPLYPQLTAVDDGGIAVPQLQLVKYRGDAGDGGFLNFDVDLALEAGAADRIRRELRRADDLEDEPRLAPVPLVDGSVRMMLFGQDSGDPNAPRAFVPKINSPTKPALYGTNQAAFSVKLDAESVTLFEAAVAGEITPVAVLYSLDYLALRPAYSVKVEADWNRVQSHLRNSFSTGVLFVSTQVDKVVDELIEDQVIRIQIDNFIPPHEDASDLLARLNAAVNEVKDMIIDTFFEPSLDPRDTDETDRLDRFTDTALRVHRSALLAGLGPGGLGLSAISVRRHEIDLERVDRRRFAFDLHERTTVRRTIHPQGHLAGLLRTIRDADGQIDIDRFVVAVDLDDPWFERRRIRVIDRADHQADDIDSIDVKLDYRGDTEGVLLERSNPEQEVTWPSALDRGGRVIQEVSASYRVAFRSSDGGARPLTIDGPTEVVDVEHLEVRPHELYHLSPVSILALDVPWELYPTIEVRVEYEDVAGGLRSAETFLLHETTPTTDWKLFTFLEASRAFRYKIVYRAADHRDVELPWETTDLEQIVVRDPFPDRRRVDVVAAVDPTEIRTMFVDLTYQDVDNDLRVERFAVFEGEDFGRRTIEFPLIDPTRRIVDYRVTAIDRRGAVMEGPVSSTVGNRIIATSLSTGHRIIRVVAADSLFARGDLTEVLVELRYRDDANDLAFADDVTFRSAEERPRYFEYDHHPGRSAYRYRITYWFTNGLSRDTAWTETDDADLVIDVD